MVPKAGTPCLAAVLLTTTGNVRNYALYFFGGMLALFAWILL